jgi:hypothetical protein
MAREVTTRERTMRADTASTTRNTERTIAWVMAVVAVVLGVIGMLRGFGIIFGSDVAVDQAVGPGAVGLANWQAGMLWFLPAIAAAFVAIALNFTEFNWAGEMRDGTENTLYRVGVVLSYVLLALAIAAGVLTLLIGFDVFDRGNTFADGIVWGMAALVAGAAGIAPRMAGHVAQTLPDEDYIVRIVEDRVAGTTRAPGTTTTRPATEPPPGDRLR